MAAPLARKAVGVAAGRPLHAFAGGEADTSAMIARDMPTNQTSGVRMHRMLAPS